MTVAALEDRPQRLCFGGRNVVRVAKIDPYARAVALTNAVCAMAGSMSLIDDIEIELCEAGVIDAIATRHTAPIFDWLLTTFSYQGVSDQAARTYMENHGTATWAQIDASLKNGCACPKLRSYWQFDGCDYRKTYATCTSPEHFEQCPLPRFRLRNGRLNQLAYSFYLFVRDIAGSDLVGWINTQLESVDALPDADIDVSRQRALIGPLAHVHGISDKVLNMTLSNLLIAAGLKRPSWFTTGISMIAVDSLVHAFIVRSGILQDCGRPHLYGPACYAEGGCADIIRALADRIDARIFNPTFPARFPRFVQHALWRYCARDGLDVCNGVRINDSIGCLDRYCRLGQKCARNHLKI